jgi:hypothetical protein
MNRQLRQPPSPPPKKASGGAIAAGILGGLATLGGAGLAAYAASQRKRKPLRGCATPCGR